MSGYRVDCLAFVVISCMLSPVVHGFAYEMTFEVEPGRRDCLYQHIAVTNVYLEIDYQVLEGRDRDISFTVKGPAQLFLRTDEKESQGSHQLHIQETGDYEFCFDNTFSRFATKMIFFELYAEFDDVSFPSALELDRLSIDVETALEVMDTAVEEIQGSLTKVRRNAEKMRSQQALIASFMKRDRNIAEHNYTRVNLFSCSYLFVMVTVSFVQVVMIRSLFKSSDAHQMKMAT